MVKFFIKKHRTYGNVTLTKTEVNVRVSKAESHLQLSLVESSTEDIFNKSLSNLTVQKNSDITITN